MSLPIIADDRLWKLIDQDRAGSPGSATRSIAWNINSQT
jgi:hypothetical protein